MDTYLEVRDLEYGTPEGRTLISHLDFQLSPSELLLISGPNGIGKSTLLQILARRRAQFSGRVDWKIKAPEVFYLPQLHNREFHINLTLFDIVRFAGKVSASRLETVCDGLLSPAQLALSWNTASGGERQKTLLARALLTQPKVLILDEPMNHLDVASRINFQNLIHRFVRSEGRSVIMVGHHSDEEWRDGRKLDLSARQA